MPNGNDRKTRTRVSRKFGSTKRAATRRAWAMIAIAGSVTSAALGFHVTRNMPLMASCRPLHFGWAHCAFAMLAESTEGPILEKAVWGKQ